MKKVQILFHDAGGGHRNAALALQAIVAEQKRPWQVDLVQFQDLTDHLDVLRKLTGIRIQEQYNTLLRNGWTLGATELLRVLQATIRVFHRPMVKLLAKHFEQQPADLMVSVIPHFNREIAEAWNLGLPRTPLCHPDHGSCGFSSALLDRAGEGTVCDLRNGTRRCPGSPARESLLPRSSLPRG